MTAEERIRVLVGVTVAVVLVLIVWLVAPGDPGLPNCPRGRPAVAVECK